MMTGQDYLDLYASGGVFPNELMYAPDFNRNLGIAPLQNLGFTKPFGGVQNYRTIQDVALDRTERGVHGRLGPEGDKVLYDHPAQYSNEMSGPAGQTMLDRGGVGYEQEGKNLLTSIDRYHNRDSWNQLPQQSPVASAPYSRPHVTQDSFNIPSTYQGPPEGLLGPTGAIGPQDSFAVSADPSLYGGSESALASAATDSATDSATGLSGPQMFAANMALNMIPTRDRKKVSTPFGDEGSPHGIFKGAGKGALTGVTLGSHFGPKGALVGGLVGGAAGLIGGSQGYFDSTSAPIMNMTRIKRGGGGMRGGLLGGGAMYG